MVKNVLFALIFTSVMLLSVESTDKVWDNNIADSNRTEEVDIYTRNCIPCHEYLPSSLERMFMTYLKVYSGEFTVKESIKAYLRNPEKDMSVMSDLFIDRFGLKYKTDLSEKELEEAVKIYWEKYDVKKKLK